MKCPMMIKEALSPQLLSRASRIARGKGSKLFNKYYTRKFFPLFYKSKTTKGVGELAGKRIGQSVRFEFPYTRRRPKIK